MDVHLRELRSFLAVAERLSFTAAAEDLFVSQPALSKQIRSLEADLRVRLFVRDRRSVRLSPAGEALVPHARAALVEWERAQAAVAVAVVAGEATLVIGMSTGIGRGLLPALRARLSARHPEVDVRLRLVPWADVTGGLAARGPDATDVALVWLPMPDPAPYEWVEVAVEERWVALPPGHRLAGLPEVPFAELLDEVFVALPSAAGAQRDHWLGAEHRDGGVPLVATEVTSTEETVEAIAAGLGVALVAEGNVPLIDRGGVVLRPVTGIGPSTLVLAWRRGDNRPLVRAAVEAVAAAAGRSWQPDPRRLSLPSSETCRD